MKGTSLLCSRVRFRSNITAHAPLGVKPAIGIPRVSVGEKKENWSFRAEVMQVKADTMRDRKPVQLKQAGVRGLDPPDAKAYQSP